MVVCDTRWAIFVMTMSQTERHMAKPVVDVGPKKLRNGTRDAQDAQGVKTGATLSFGAVCLGVFVANTKKQQA